MLTSLIMDVCRASRARLCQSVGEGTPRPYNQLRLLQVVQTEEIRSQSTLAERLVIDPPAVSRAIDKLEGDGLLERIEGEDRRCSGLRITTAATAEIQHLVDAQIKVSELIVAHLDETERGELVRLLQKVKEALRNDDAMAAIQCRPPDGCG